jgi:hypothetical protein
VGARGGVPSCLSDTLWCCIYGSNVVWRCCILSWPSWGDCVGPGYFLVDSLDRDLFGHLVSLTSLTRIWSVAPPRRLARRKLGRLPRLTDDNVVGK